MPSSCGAHRAGQSGNAVVPTADRRLRGTASDLVRDSSNLKRRAVSYVGLARALDSVALRHRDPMLVDAAAERKLNEVITSPPLRHLAAVPSRSCIPPVSYHGRRPALALGRSEGDGGLVAVSACGSAPGRVPAVKRWSVRLPLGRRLGRPSQASGSHLSPRQPDE